METKRLLATEAIGSRSQAEVTVRPIVKLVGTLLAVALTLSVLEGLAYLYLRMHDGYDGTHLVSYQFDDYKIILPTPNYANLKGIYHNAQGFRERENTPRQKDPGLFRIFLMGGSTAYGLGSLSSFGQERYSLITNEETIDYYLEDYLKQKFPGRRIEVINAAITSHYSHHHLIYLNQTILKYDPDMVIFIDGFNDYYPYKKGFDQFADYAYQERAHLFMGEPSGEAWLTYSGWWLFRKSHFVHLAAKTLRPVGIAISRIGARRQVIDVKDALENLRENAGRNFVKMVERNGLILKYENVIPVFALQPEIAFRQAKKFSPLEQNIFREMDAHWQENYVQFKNEARPMVAKYLEESTAKTGSTFIDLTDIYGGVDGDVYTDYCHLTPLGNKRLAEVLGDQVAPQIRNKMDQRRS
jgi:lysophospholipase L1-like esterase